MRIPNLVTGVTARLPSDYAPQGSQDLQATSDATAGQRDGAKAKLRSRGRVRKRKGEMNKTEAAFAAKLRQDQNDGLVFWWGFEAVTLRLADRTTWTADFVVMDSNCVLKLIDVKGAKKTKAGNYVPFVEQHTSVKIKVAAEQFPIAICVAYQLPKKCGGEWVIEEV